jgi:biopolymer transport protein ExbB
MMKTFFAKLTAVAAPFVLALSLTAAMPQAANAQATPAPAPAATAASAAEPTANSVAAPAAVAAPAPAAVAPVAMPAAPAKVDNPYGIGALWAQSDLVAKAVLAILAIMSMGSWYVIVTKLLEQMRMGRQAKEVDNEFWNERTVQAGTAKLADGSPFRFIADAGVHATKKHDGLRGKVDFADFVDLCIHRATERVQRRLSNGMSLLATVGSTAPFVGLFGTVWGIYNALVPHRRFRPGVDRQGGRPGGRGADHDGHRPGRGRACGAGLQLAGAPQHHRDGRRARVQRRAALRDPGRQRRCLMPA